MLYGAPYELLCNTADEVVERNMIINSARKVSRFAPQPEKVGEVIVIVGGGPSLKDHIDGLRARVALGQKIWATNNTYSWLKSRGIQPAAQIILDARPEMAAMVEPEQGVTFFLGQGVHPSVYDKLEGCDVVMYHGRQPGTGFTVGIKAMYLASNWGYKTLALYGFDSSYSDDGEHHAYAQSLNDRENTLEVMFENHRYRCAPWMAIQAEEFRQVALSFAEQGATIVVAGDGLLPAVARSLARIERVLTAVWDLAVCPPTYDIHTFLAEAERHRRKIGATWIDLIIQPGPLGGFRDDELPPNYGSRVGMLYRVNVGMARLLPSIRNIEILKARREVKADDIFPVGYDAKTPIHHYGPSYLQAEPMFQATEAARAMVKRYRTNKRRPYVTITMRQASHWPSRNSDMFEWLRVKEWLSLRGYDVEWVPDTESNEANVFSWDLDIRLALYEGAALNLGINNGPTCMWWFCDVPFIIFKMVTPDVPWTSAEFMERFGIKPGPCGERGMLVFEPDKYEVITRAITEYFDSMKKKEAA